MAPHMLVTRLCEQLFCTKNTFLTVSVIRKLAIIKKQEYLIRAHCVRHVKYVMQRMSRDRLLKRISADSLLAPYIFCVWPRGQEVFWGHEFFLKKYNFLWPKYRKTLVIISQKLLYMSIAVDFFLKEANNRGARIIM